MLLSEGRAGEAWRPSNKVCCFSLSPPQYKSVFS